MRSLFPGAQLRLLTEDGAIVDADGAPAKADGELLLSRALCRFLFFPAPEGLPSGELSKAARFKAEAEAPFRDAGTLILRAPGGAAIWFWDRAHVAGLLRKPVEAEIRVTPESLYRGSTSGWRIIQVSGGYEAQCWREGSLIASTWRRREFTTAQWQAFALGVEHPEFGASEQPPVADAAPLVADRSWQRQRIGAPFSWSRAEELARTAAICAAGLAMFCAGYAFHLDRLADRDERAAQTVHTQLLADPGARRARAQLELVNAYQHAMPAVNVLDVGGDALEAVRAFGIDATTWSVSDHQLRLSMPYIRSQTPLRDILGSLQARPHLRDVSLEFEPGGDTVVFTATIDASTQAAPR